MVYDVFDMTRRKKNGIVCDVVDVIGDARFEDTTGESEVQRTVLALINQAYVFDKCQNTKVLMATNSPDMLS